MTEALRSRLEGFAPIALLTLGSGLGALADEVDDPLVIPFAEVGLPVSTVPGHAGRLLAGTLHGAPVLVQQGRVHLYENRTPAEVTAVVRAAAAAGADALIVTNAAGGLDPSMAPGELALLVDQLNLTSASPLIGRAEPAFVDMGEPYDVGLRTLAHQGATQVGERLREAVYAGLVGPAFETPAEVRMLRTLGADVVGMSTVLEVIAARAQGLRVVGFSLITNVHRPGIATSHAEVLEAGAAAGPRLAEVLRALLSGLAGEEDAAARGREAPAGEGSPAGREAPGAGEGSPAALEAPPGG